MSTQPAPLPCSGTFLTSVRRSCAASLPTHGLALSASSIDAFLSTLSPPAFDRLKAQHGLTFPLSFPTLTSELNFLALLALLNFLSAYRAPLHAHTGAGSYQNVQRLLLALYVTGGEDAAANAVAGSRHLTAAGLKRLDAAAIAQIWGVGLHEEREHESLRGVTVGVRGGVMNEVVELVVGVCNDTGERLERAAYPSLGVFTMEVLKQVNRTCREKGEREAVDLFVEKFVAFLPSFNDSYLPSPSDRERAPIYIFKKVFFLYHALFSLLDRSSAASGGLTLPDPRKHLPMFVDNVIPTMLVRFGILDLSQARSPTLRAWSEKQEAAQGAEGPRLNREEAYALRAAALYAGEKIVERARVLAKQGGELAWLEELNEVDLDGYLWAVAKDDEKLRAVPRMVELKTVMY
ncbi:hypothetical protein ACQY0O_004999 [Thecaphora frezii]